MGRHRRLRRTSAATAVCAALAVSAAAPSLASGQSVVDDLLRDLGLGGQGATQAAGGPAGRGKQSSARGSNPGGQGARGTSAKSADGTVVPSSPLPLGDESSNSTDGSRGEDVVLGGSRGEQDPDGTYGGVVNVISLFGFDVVPPVESRPGESESGVLEPIQQNVLDPICAGTGGQLCLAILQPGSEPNPGSTNAGSRSSFNAFKATAGGRESPNGTSPESSGNLQPGSSNGPQSNVARSGTGAWLACGSGPPDAEFTVFSPVRSLVCDASNSAGKYANPAGITSDATHWLGVREALALLLLLSILGLALLMAPSIMERYQRPGY
jgi:uncharacterized low-complexity protein